MKYTPINNDTKQRIFKLLECLYDEVMSAGGDGDGLWCSRFYDINDIFPIVEEFNNSQKYPWKITKEDDNDGTYILLTGHIQDYIIITNSEEKFLCPPEWQQIVVRY